MESDKKEKVQKQILKFLDDVNDEKLADKEFFMEVA